MRTPEGSGERGIGHFGELSCPAVEARLTGRAGYLVECMHPLGQIVKVLAIALLLELGIERFVEPSLRKLLADAQPAERGL